MLKNIFVLVVLLVFFISIVSAIEVNLDCSDEIYAGKEFSCDVAVSDGKGNYDLKIEADTERDSVLKIWNGKNWQSGYYYVKDFVHDKEEIKLKIMKEGQYDLIVKLRDGGWRKEFDAGKLKVYRDKQSSISNEAEKENVKESIRKNSLTLPILKNKSFEIISLNDDIVSESGEKWDYVSKDGMVIDWLPYIFCLFLIFLVGILLWDKFKM